MRQSLVLLKNDGVLPLSPRANILVTGDGADNIAMQSGGWSVTWQGRDTKNSDFPGATSIYSGIKTTLEASGGAATLSPDGGFTEKPDAAIVIFGETPYAEFEGDLETEAGVDFESEAGLNALRSLRDAGVPTVAVFLSGRPRWVTPEI
ncbi:MAG: glycoside hydrolase family 3 C-terminal domain-containing protein, partial [Pseudomonadota bacterium]